METKHQGKANKMCLTKIVRYKKVSKRNRGYNSLFLVRCNKCGEIFFTWDTDMYTRVCPMCKNEGKEDLRTLEEKRNDCFRVNRRLFCEFRARNPLSSKENSLLVDFRERKSLSSLMDLISDYWLTPADQYQIIRREQYCISKRARKLLKNQDFIDLLKQCFDIAMPREKGGVK